MKVACHLIAILWFQGVRANKTNTVPKLHETWYTVLKHFTNLRCLYSWSLLPSARPCCRWCHLWARLWEISKDTVSENALSRLTLSRILMSNVYIFPFLLSFFCFTLSQFSINLRHCFITPCHLPYFQHPHLRLYCLITPRPRPLSSLSV